MNNYDAIKNQWDSVEMARYPHLFNFVVDKMVKGMKEEKKSNNEMI